MVFSFELGKPLTDAQLRNLKDHRYAAAGSTLLDPVMQPFWRYAINYIPLWMAPNLITLIGLALNVISTSIMFIYSPDIESEVPSWVYVLCAICLFCYQTLDALDGKQARRTGSSSPLGELFDHGCDAVSMVFLILSACVAAGLGSHQLTSFFISMYAYVTFYGAHWETYVTGKLQFHTMDVTEGHFFVIIVYLITAAFGVSLWRTTFTIPVLGVAVELSHLLIFIVVLCATWMWLQNVFTIFVRGGVGKNGSTVADTSVAFPIVPLAIIWVSAHVINTKSKFKLFHDAPVVYLLLFGFIVAKASTRLIIAHMSRSEFHAMDSSLIAPGVLSLNQYFNEPVDDHMLLYVCLVFTLLDFIYYSTCVCVQISQFLNIEVFRIKPVLDSSTNSSIHQEVNGASLSTGSGRKLSARANLTNGDPRSTRRSGNARKQLSLHE